MKVRSACHIFKNRWALFAAVIGLVVLIGAACGGDEAASPTPSSTEASPTPRGEEQTKGTITLVEQDWTGQLVVTELARVLLVEHLGYQVKKSFVSADSPAQFAGMARGDLHASLEIWPSYNEDNINTYIHDGPVLDLGPLGLEGNSGWWVPTYVIKGDPERGIEPMAPDLVSWEQLNNYKDIFATAQTAPKGRLLDAAPAYNSRNKERIEALGLDFENIFSGSETGSIAEVKAAYDRGEAIIFYWWEPHWLHAELDLTEIQLPSYSDECWATGFGCDWPTDVVIKTGSSRLQNEAPDAYEVLKNLTLSNEEQGEMINAVDNLGKSVEQVVREWMAANSDKWQAWLP